MLSEDKNLRKITGLMIGCHLIPLINPIMDDAVSIWRRLQTANPKDLSEFQEIVRKQAKETVIAL